MLHLQRKLREISGTDPKLSRDLLV
jgi:hypothetical protein